MSTKKTLTVTLDEENARGLLFAADVLEEEPEDLLNEWVLRDEMRDVLQGETGILRDWFEATIFEDEETAQRIGNRIVAFEKKAGLNCKEPPIRQIDNGNE